MRVKNNERHKIRHNTIFRMFDLRGHCTPNSKLLCFVCYLEIISNNNNNNNNNKQTLVIAPSARRLLSASQRYNRYMKLQLKYHN